ncbi:type II toxin-antitoxin system RelB/DinJ family antitoxin [Bifidobacterium sp. ESL0732]|uniref:type II toxin-antitoxin system RelB/DinJ family antitoxin n=1 Tax=Bifidobacterium sp. ESL0732 TaxID=2983222 RepID=UPI0023F66D31|nr:type II toxin-antitoxin system RelB/DinJ family antitoxin [Bifidobacterium sp. ESL0732]WEV64422.1 type II toxin-antitoxin system RelB/DinJ family antitoxin [Bifidobacterium sp. ESL0732]
MTTQLATRVDDQQAALFKRTAQKLGTTAADALRMFVAAFNDNQGFPYDVRLKSQAPEPFATEQEATDFASKMAGRLLSETR